MTAQRTSPLKRIFILSSLLLVAVTTAAHARTDEPIVGEPAIGEPRLSTSTINGATNTSHYPPIPIDKRLDRSEATTRNRTVQHHNHGLWIFDISINLTTDNDIDGHYSAFNVTLDVDTSFSARSVYAVLYLRQNNGPLLEYAVTGNFTVSGNASADAVFVETSLDSGYPSGYYDHYVEVYDATTGALLIAYGPDDNHHNHSIPFESSDNDYYYFDPITVQLSFSGTGSIAPSTIAIGSAMLIVVFRRRRQTRLRKN